MSVCLPDFFESSDARDLGLMTLFHLKIDSSHQYSKQSKQGFFKGKDDLVFSRGHQLYNRLCPSMGPWVRPSVHRPSLRPSARVDKWKNKRFRSCLCVLERGSRVGMSWTPLPTRPQPHCNLASLVYLLHRFC